MQAEMENEGHAMPVHMAGVNEPGSEAGNDAFTVGLGLPWLQDTAAEMVGASWGAEHFDLVILGPDNVEVAIYSLIEFDLSDPANYEEIKQALAAIADRQIGAAGMNADAQHGGADIDMEPGAHGMHDDVRHSDADMHEDMEHGDMHRGMGDAAAGMHEDPSEPCPADGIPVGDTSMHGSASHSHP